MEKKQKVNEPVRLRQNLITEIYIKVFPSAAKFIANRGGSMADAKDVFHDAVIIYYEKMMQGVLDIDVDETVYLMGITRNLWFRKFRKPRDLSLEEQDLEIMDMQGDDAPASEKILIYLKAAGKKCMDLLQAFYYEKTSLKSIADRFGYGSTRSATVQKYKCLEKVRDQVKQKSLNYADFIE